MTLTNFMNSISKCKKFLLSCVAMLSICTSVYANHDQAPVSDIDHTGYGNFSGNYTFSDSDHVWFVFNAQAGDTIRFQLTTNFGSYAWIYRSNTGTVAVGDATTTIGGNGALTLKSVAGFFSPNSTNTVTYIVDSTGQFAIQLDHHTGSGTAGSYSVVFSTSGNVNTTPDAVATPSTQSICSGTTITTMVLTGSTSGTVYNWTRDNFATVNGIAASGSGDISGSLTNTTNAPITVTFTITPTANGTAGAPVTATVVVNPTATVTTVTNQVICNGLPTTAVTFTSPTSGGTIVYNWTNNTTSIGLAASGTGDIPSFTATNTTTAPVTATITVTPSYTNAGVTCVGKPITYTYTVNPTATVNAVANQVICNNGPTTAVTFSSPTTGGTIVYNWTNNTTSIGLAASGTGNIPSFTATNTTTAPVTATITVTPSYTNAGVTCVGTPRTFTITVNPTATVNPVANQVLCNNLPTTAVTFTSPTTGGTIVYNWTNTTTSIGLAASGTGNIASFTATNTTQAPVVATITVTPSYTNAGVTCVGTPRTFTITVNPSPIVTLAPFASICKNAAPITLTGGSPVAGAGTTGVYLVNNVAQTIFNPAIKHVVARLMNQKWGAQFTQNTHGLFGLCWLVIGNSHIKCATGTHNIIQCLHGFF